MSAKLRTRSQQSDVPTRLSEDASALVRPVYDGASALAWVFRAEYEPTQTRFPTPNEFPLQVGYVVYPAGGVVAAHRHLPIERHLVGTAEVLFVKRGRALADFYGLEGQLVESIEVFAGDLIVLIGGGHGFRMLEDTVLIEVKQGPCLAVQEKERL